MPHFCNKPIESERILKEPLEHFLVGEWLYLVEGMYMYSIVLFMGIHRNLVD